MRNIIDIQGYEEFSPYWSLYYCRIFEFFKILKELSDCCCDNVSAGRCCILCFRQDNTFPASRMPMIPYWVPVHCPLAPG